jgi:hypothetical protein
LGNNFLILQNHFSILGNHKTILGNGLFMTKTAKNHQERRAGGKSHALGIFWLRARTTRRGYFLTKRGTWKSSPVG